MDFAKASVSVPGRCGGRTAVSAWFVNLSVTKHAEIANF
ncbi:hypothetical protein MELE44368_19175 [Mycolicibacterium elephantis DSM 44368]|uniref:Uncharacterized protein n=1 Tax=Mycolicibacterium elephantis DSM 44368 TaxID=1335622 RepID=A0A439DU26_9MYCO|nr:hypothetical protein MELE44368_19175 [Mycolicibacterium elephantis DSM 44368]